MGCVRIRAFMNLLILWRCHCSNMMLLVIMYVLNQIGYKSMSCKTVSQKRQMKQSMMVLTFAEGVNAQHNIHV